MFRRLALLVAPLPLLLSLAACTSFTARLQFDCSMTGAVSPGWAVRTWKDGNDKNALYSTLSGDAHHKVYGSKTFVSQFNIEVKSVKRALPGAFFTCHAFAYSSGNPYLIGDCPKLRDGKMSCQTTAVPPPSRNGD